MIQMLTNKIRASQLIKPQSLYYIAEVIIVTKMLLAYSAVINTDGFVNTAFNGAFMLLMLIKLAMGYRRVNIKRYTFYALFIALAAYTGIKTDNYIILISVMGVTAIEDMDIKNVIRVMFVTKTFWLAVHAAVFIYTALFAPDNIQYTVINDVVRYHMCFIHPNTCAMLFLWTMFEYLYLNYNRLSPKVFFVCTVILLPVLLLTGSKTAAIVYILFWLIQLLVNVWRVKDIICLFAKYGFIILTAVHVIMTVFYRKLPFHNLMFWISTGRIGGAAKAFELAGCTLAGQYVPLGVPIEWDSYYGLEIIFLENTYTLFFINLGIIYLIILSAVLWYVTRYLNMCDTVFVCLALIYGINESHIINVFCCFAFLVVGDAVINKNRYISDMSWPRTVRD